MPSLVELERALENAVGHQPFAPGLDDGRIDELLHAFQQMSIWSA